MVDAYFRGWLPARDGTPEGVADIGVETFKIGDEGFDIRAGGGSLERAGLLLRHKSAECGVPGEVTLLDQTERTDELQRHLVHLKLGIDGRELSLEDQVHEQSLDYIVLVMAESDLVAAELLCGVEQRLAAVPRAEETG